MTHDAAMNTVEFINGHFEIGPDDRCLALSTLECDLSVLDIFGMLRAGASIVVVDEEQRRDPDAWARLIERHGVTVLHFMPGWLEMLSEVDGDLSSVRVVPTGGDWVRPRTGPRAAYAGPAHAVRRSRRRHRDGHAQHDLRDRRRHPGGLDLGAARGAAAQQRVPRRRTRTGLDCPDWVPGELWVGGRGVARGYSARPDLTAERFVHHDGQTWYRTGDLVRYRPGRRHRVRRPRRPSDQDQRLPGRTRRGGIRAAPHRRCRLRRGGGRHRSRRPRRARRTRQRPRRAATCRTRTRSSRRWPNSFRRT